MKAADAWTLRLVGVGALCMLAHNDWAYVFFWALVLGLIVTGAVVSRRRGGEP